MLYTVFLNSSRESLTMAGMLLERSWIEAGQHGALVALSPWLQSKPSLEQRAAQLVLPPKTRDFGGPDHTNLAKAVLDWVFGAKPQGSILLFNDICMFRQPVSLTARPGRPCAVSKAREAQSASNNSRFGQREESDALAKYGVDPVLPVPPIDFPILIHAQDLRKIAARWLQLATIMSDECLDSFDASLDALSIAASEYGLEFEPRALTTHLAASDDLYDASTPPLARLDQPVLSDAGQVVFDARNPAGEILVDDAAATENGRLAVALARQQLAVQPGVRRGRPMRKSRVKEGWVLDRAVLIRGRDEAKAWVNTSGHEIWSLCDGSRSIDEIAASLAVTYGGQAEDYAGAVAQFVDSLQGAGLLWSA